MADVAEDTTQLENAVEREESVAFASLVYVYKGRRLCARVAPGLPVGTDPAWLCGHRDSGAKAKNVWIYAYLPSCPQYPIFTAESNS
jgi:hypothetical protein